MVIYVKSLFFILSILFFINADNFINASQFFVNDSMYAYELDNDIYIRKNGILIDIVSDSNLLDFNNDYLIFNIDENIYLYNLVSNQKEYISHGFNALIYHDFIIYETISSEFKCRNIINNKYDNCYKIYLYDIKNKSNKYLDINGSDIYINDLENDFLIYNSIHFNDDVCNGVCSYVGVYNLNDYSSKIIMGDNIDITYAGNGYISNGEVIFEAIINEYSCDSVQVLKYDLNKNDLTILLDNGVCFNKDIEILDFNDKYFLFKSNLNNYENSQKLIYVYSIEDNKYSRVEMDKFDLKIFNNEIIYINNHSLNYQKMDNISPYLDDSIRYDVLLGKEEIFLNNLKIRDNLSNRENIEVILLDKIENEGEYYISIKLIDSFNNEATYDILISAVRNDVISPRIYVKDRIILKKGDYFNINDYGYSMDDIDGRIELYLNEGINTNYTGEYDLIVYSSDSSNNVSYKKIEVIIYDNDLIYNYYIMCVFISILMIAIIYIFRFKKWVWFCYNSQGR